MNRYSFLKNLMIALILTGLYVYPDVNALPNTDPHRYHGTQPRVYINQGLYPDYEGIYYNGSTVRGNTIIQPIYNLPPAREPLRSPNSAKGRLTIDQLPPRK